MPPPSDSEALHLQVLSSPFFVVQFQLGEKLPAGVLEDMNAVDGRFFSVTRTNDEISIVGESYETMRDEYKAWCTWTCIKIRGPMEHSKCSKYLDIIHALPSNIGIGLTGIMATFTEPLKEAKVPVFALSTWNTDYVLVPTELLPDAITCLKQDGWGFIEQ